MTSQDSDPPSDQKQLAIERVQSAEFRRAVLWPMHRMLRSCTEPDCLQLPYLGCNLMTVGDRFVRRAKTSVMTPFFSFSFPREMCQEGSGSF